MREPVRGCSYIPVTSSMAQTPLLFTCSVGELRRFNPLVLLRFLTTWSTAAC